MEGSLSTVITSALQTVAGDIKTVMFAVLPIGLGITGLTIATRKGLGFFRSVTK